MRPALAALMIAGAGAGCSVDVPPARSPEGDEDAVPVSLLQGQGDDAPSTGDAVFVSDVVVTAVDTFDETGGGAKGTIYVGDADGGPFSGIAVFAPTIVGGATLRVGDVVSVEGELAEFELGQIDPDWADDTGRTVTQIVRASVQWTGEWRPPEPAQVSIADLSADPEAERWEGVLVEVADVTALSDPDEGSRVTLSDGLELDDDLFRVDGAVQGATFDSIRGVVSYLYRYRLLPRSAEDVARQ